MAKTGEKSVEKRSKRRTPLNRAPLNVGGARHFVMGACAAVIMFSGGVLLGGAMERYFEWLGALADPPLAFSPLGKDALANKGLGGEIALAAQIDSPRAYYVPIRRRDAFVAPLYPPDADRRSDPVTALLWEPAGAPAEEDFANWIRSVGGVGVVIEFLGKEYQPDQALRDRVAAALAADGLRLAPDAVFVDPHHRARRYELAPPSFGITFGAVVIGVGGAMGLLAMRSAERERRRRVRQARRQAAKEARAARKEAKKAEKAAKRSSSTPTEAKPVKAKVEEAADESKAGNTIESAQKALAPVKTNIQPAENSTAKTPEAKTDPKPSAAQDKSAKKGQDEEKPSDAVKGPNLKITGVSDD